MAYTFTCPLEGCNHTVMTSQSDDMAAANDELTKAASKHLAEMHPDIHKMHEEVHQDISANMTKQQ